MRPTKTYAAAGLGLALALATVTATTGDDDTAAAADGGRVVAASVDRPVIVDMAGEHDFVRSPYADELRVDRSETVDAIVAQLVAEDAAAEAAYAAAVDEALAARAAAPAPAAPAPAPAPSYAAGSVEDIITRYFGASASKAIAVARCESSLNPNAVSAGGGNHGLFQINNVHSGTWQSVTGAPWSARYDAELNTKFAHWLWSQQGWGPWACA